MHGANRSEQGSSSDGEPCQRGVHRTGGAVVADGRLQRHRDGLADEELRSNEQPDGLGDPQSGQSMPAGARLFVGRDNDEEQFRFSSQLFKACCRAYAARGDDLQPRLVGIVGGNVVALGKEVPRYRGTHLAHSGHISQQNDWYPQIRVAIEHRASVHLIKDDYQGGAV